MAVGDRRASARQQALHVRGDAARGHGEKTKSAVCAHDMTDAVKAILGSEVLSFCFFRGKMTRDAAKAA